MICKHIRKIIDGDDSILFDKNQKNDLEKIKNHVKSTQIPLLLSEIEKSEELLVIAKKNVEDAKKKLSNAILNKLEQ